MAQAIDVADRAAVLAKSSSRGEALGLVGATCSTKLFGVRAMDNPIPPAKFRSLRSLWPQPRAEDVWSASFRDLPVFAPSPAFWVLGMVADSWLPTLAKGCCSELKDRRRESSSQ